MKRCLTIKNSVHEHHINRNGLNYRLTDEHHKWSDHRLGKYSLPTVKCLSHDLRINSTVRYVRPIVALIRCSYIFYLLFGIQRFPQERGSAIQYHGRITLRNSKVKQLEKYLRVECHKLSRRKNRPPTCTTTVKIEVDQNTHLQSERSAIQAPVVGPRTGPRRGARE
jgi:hypothetical protein